MQELTDDQLPEGNVTTVGLAMEKLEAMIYPVTLSDVPQLGADILKGKVKGRVVVDVE